MEKQYKAYIFWSNGEKTITLAKKEKRRWIIGGECINAYTDLGAKVFIEKNDGVFYLKGCRLIYQDTVGALD